MAITVEHVEQSFDLGGDDPYLVDQLRFDINGLPEFFLDPDEAEQVLNAIEGVLTDIGYFTQALTN